jgi:phosphoadenosine phosphosulfate reductase
LPVVFLDTGFHFDETLAYRDALVARLGLTVKVVRSATPTRRFLELHGSDIQKRNSDLCCAENKVAPLQPELIGKRAWISGLRRDQGRTRDSVKVVQPTDGGVAKVHPIADWTARDVYQYLRAHDLPEHPLFEQGYMSIGCAPCTRPITDGESERDGRWAGSAKTECGLHTFLKPAG